MNLKNEVDAVLRRVFYLTQAIKQLEPVVQMTGNRKTKSVLVETLYEYQKVAGNARELLSRYIRQERDLGATPIEYYRVYRKLGETNE